MAPAAGSRPDFFWWGLTARLGEFALLDGDPQIRRHAQGIAEAVARADRLTRDRLSLALKTGGLLASLGLLGPVLGALVAEAGNARDAIGLLRSAPAVAQSRARLLEAALRRNSGTVFSVGLRPQALAAAEDDGRCLALVASMLPVLVAVQDAQLLDAVTIRVLETLSRQSGAAGLIVLAVSTDQPVGLAGDALGGWLGAEDRAQRLTRVRLGPLSDEELTEIAIAELGTGLDAGMLARVVRHADGVPGILCDLLDAPAVAQALRAGGEGPADLAAISGQVGVQAALAASPTLVRRVLAVAAVHGRMTVRDWLCDPGSPPPPGLVTAAAVDAAIAAGWLQRRPGTPVVEWGSSHVLHAARAAQDRELTPATIRAVRQALLAAVQTAHADHSWDDLDQDVRESLLASVIEDDPRTPAEILPPALAAELLTLRRVTGRDAATAAFLAALTDRLASGQPHPRVLIVATAEALFDQGQADEAFRLLRDDYTRLKAEYGEDHPRTWPALHNLAAAYAAAAQALHGQPQSAPLYQTAIALYDKLLNARVTTLPAGLEQVIRTRAQYARLLAYCYRYREALTQGEILLGEQQAARPADHPDILATRNNLADWCGDAGDPASAAAAYSEVLKDVLRMLGPDDPNTLATRHKLAQWRGQAGDAAGAAAACQELLADQLRVLGPDHRDTLATRNSLAAFRGQAGDPVGAAAAYQELLADQLRVLGPDHHDTLTTRNNLAYSRWQAGDPAGTSAAYQELLADQLRALGPDHRDTLATRRNLASIRGRAGDPTAAAAAYSEVLKDVLRVLGPDDPDTLATRRNLAHWRGQAGDPAGAAAAYQELLADQLRALDPDHPDTLATRRNLAHWRGQAGDPAGAAAAYQELLADMLRVLGPDHPETLAARHWLAHWQRQAGSHTP